MILSELLTIIFGALFLLFGLLMVFVEDEAWGVVWTGLCLLCLGCGSLSLARGSVQEGEIRLQYTHFVRRKSPRAFWLIVGVVVLAGCGSLIMGVWVLVF